MAEVGGPLSGGGADEDQAKMSLELVGEFFQVGVDRWGGLAKRNPPYCGSH
jgi:hypothetical protein